MPKINNKEVYSLATALDLEDYLIGSKKTGETINYPLSLIAGDIPINLEQDNKYKLLSVGYTVDNGKKLYEIVNEFDFSGYPAGYNQVSEKEIPIIKITHAVPNTKRYDTYHIVRGAGKGTYGLGGTVVLDSTSLIEIRSTLAEYTQNVMRVITTDAYDGTQSIADVINYSSFSRAKGIIDPDPTIVEYLNVTEEDIIIFKVPTYAKSGNGVQYDYRYFFLINNGTGRYCKGGDITLTNADLFEFNKKAVATISSDKTEAGKVYSIRTHEEITAISGVVNAINNDPLAYPVDTTKDYYFNIQQIEAVAREKKADEDEEISQVNMVQEKLYRFIGDASTTPSFGQGGNEVIQASDLLLVDTNQLNEDKGTSLRKIVVGAVIRTNETIADAVNRSFRGQITIDADETVVFEALKEEEQVDLSVVVYKTKHQWKAGTGVINSDSVADDYEEVYSKMINTLPKKIGGANPSIIYGVNDVETNTPEQAVNNSNDSYVIGDDKHTYFLVAKNDITSTDNKLYKFIGANGTYGNGGAIAVNADFELVVEEDSAYKGTNEMDNMANMTSSKSTPIDADNLSLWDSVAIKFTKLTWANLKATLKTYFDAIYSTFSGDYNDLSNKPDLTLKADKSNVLELNNTDTFVPLSDYNPATKKYADEASIGKTVVPILGDYIITVNNQNAIIIMDDASDRNITIEDNEVVNMKMGASIELFNKNIGIYTLTAVGVTVMSDVGNTISQNQKRTLRKISDTELILGY